LKYWTASDVTEQDDVPLHTAIIAAELMEWLEHGECPPDTRLLSIGTSDDDNDEWAYELLIELAPGVLLPVEHCCLEYMRDGDYDDDHNEPRNVLATAIEGITFCEPRIEAISDFLHDIRVRARKIFAGWNAEGLPTRLIDVRLAPYDHWRGSDVPAIVVLIEGFGSRLEPATEEVPVDPSEDLEKRLETCRPHLEWENAERMRLMSLGATGTIDKLALNAVNMHGGGLHNYLERFSTEGSLWLPDGTGIVISNGRVQVISEFGARVQWSGDRMTVRWTSLPKAVLKAAVGRPVGDLVHHDLLTPDMIVIEARNLIEDGLPVLSIRYTQTKWVFCATSGRVWEQPDAVEASDVIGGTVVPFKRRPPAAC